MTTPLSFRAAGATDLGTVRTNNEDAALMSARLVALADGMGGHAAGEVASAVVIDRLTSLVLATGDDATAAPDLSLEHLTEALEQARETLRVLSAVDPSMAGMGTTLVALAVAPEGVLLAHVGDSRLYRLRGGAFEPLTTDHTHVQRLVEAGRLDPAAVREHPFRSIILRSLDDTSDDLPDIAATDAVAAGDRLLLCSDGLSDYVTDDAIARELEQGSPQEAADRLIDLALGQATRDNVTVVVVDVVEGRAGDDDDGEGGAAAVDEAAAGEATADAEEATADGGDDDGPGDDAAVDDEAADDDRSVTTAPVPVPPRALGATLAAAELSEPAREVLAILAAQHRAARSRAEDNPDLADADEPAVDDEAAPPEHSPTDEEPTGEEPHADEPHAHEAAPEQASDDTAPSSDELDTGDRTEARAAAEAATEPVTNEKPAEPANGTVEESRPAVAAARSGLWLGLVVLTFLLTTGFVWMTQT